MFLKSIQIHAAKFPTQDHYPFNLSIIQSSGRVSFPSQVTFFTGENGSGKTTLLESIARHCGIYIWGEHHGRRVYRNQYEKFLFTCLSAEWTNGKVAGSLFSSQVFHRFSEILEEWAVDDPGILDYFGGQSLLTQSHGQSLMSYFRNRFKIPGLYFMDEPETALSPKTQIELLNLIRQMSEAGHAQFIIASHSPILLACPDAVIYSFDGDELEPIPYEETDYYRVTKDFLQNTHDYLNLKPQ